MGIKGDKLTKASELSAEWLKKELAAIEGISTKKMFGGHGIFHEGKMFGLIDSKGVCFLKCDESNRDDFTSVGAEQHSRMPYYSVPLEVLNDNKKLVEWVQGSIKISK